MQTDCIFCRIANKTIPAKIVYEDETVVGFRDLNPVAPTHILIIPRKHVSGLADSTPEDAQMLGKLLNAAKIIAKQEKLEPNGFRVVINNGANAGQTVFHLHIHLLGGRSFSWPPG